MLAVNEGGLDPAFSQQGAVVLWWAVALALAFGILPRARVAPVGRLVLALLAALVGWTLVALLWTESIERTATDVTRVVGYAGVVVIALLGLSRETWRAAAGGLVAALLTIPVLALARRLGPELFSGPAADDTGRLAYPLGYWNALACWCAMAMAAGIAWSTRLSSWRRPAIVALAAVAGVSLFLTYSRAGIVAAALGITLVTIIAGDRRTTAIHAAAVVIAAGAVAWLITRQPEVADGTGTDGRALIAGATVLGAAFCAAVARLTALPSVSSRLHARGKRGGWALGACALVAVAGVLAFSLPAQPAVDGGSAVVDGTTATRLADLEGPRPELWRSALAAAASEPVLGIGPGTFEFWWTRDVAGGERVRDAHSLYLETLAELGPVGLLLVLGLLIAFVLAFRRLRGSLERTRDLAAATAVFAAGFVFCVHAAVDWMWEVPAVAVAGLGGLAVAAAGCGSQRGDRPRLRPKRLALVGVAIVAGLLQLPGAVAEDRLRGSEIYLRLGFEEKASELANDAIRAAPWAASPHSQAAFVALIGGSTADAREEVATAIDREPTNWRHRYLALWIELDAGSPRRARLALDALIDLVPALEPERAEFEDEIASLGPA